jgi:hypothetical protein
MKRLSFNDDDEEHLISDDQSIDESGSGEDYESVNDNTEFINVTRSPEVQTPTTVNNDDTIVRRFNIYSI